MKRKINFSPNCLRHLIYDTTPFTKPQGAGLLVASVGVIEKYKPWACTHLLLLLLLLLLLILCNINITINIIITNPYGAGLHVASVGVFEKYKPWTCTHLTPILRVLKLVSEEYMNTLGKG